MVKKSFMCLLVAFSLIISSTIVHGKTVVQHNSLEGNVFSKGNINILKGSMTLSQYEAFLDKKAETDPGALEVKKELSKLSRDKKNKVIYYLNHPEIMEKVFKTEVEPNSKREFFNGDIVVTRESKTTIVEEEDEKEVPKSESFIQKLSSIFESSGYAAPKKVYTMKVEDTQKQTFFGKIPQAIFKVWCMYKSDKKTVKSIISGNGHCANYYPFVGVSKDGVNTYVYGNKAHTAMVWKIIPMNVGLVHFNRHHHALGFANGNSTYRYFIE